MFFVRSFLIFVEIYLIYYYLIWRRRWPPPPPPPLYHLIFLFRITQSSRITFNLTVNFSLSILNLNFSAEIVCPFNEMKWFGCPCSMHTHTTEEYNRGIEYFSFVSIRIEMKGFSFISFPGIIINSGKYFFFYVFFHFSYRTTTIIMKRRKCSLFSLPGNISFFLWAELGCSNSLLN